MLGPLDLASQSTFAGRYRVLRRLAAGGMGAVFEVVHIETQRRRALKVMLPELLSDNRLRERFQMEARITANVESDYIVDVFDAGVDDTTGVPFLVMELLNGEDLGKVLERAGPLSSEQTITYLRQVASALDKTHAAGIVHRDLKPENLFLTHREDGTPRVKILDFGISRVLSEANSAASATRAVGTPLYMAPEQVHAQRLSPGTDLYALGLIAYTLLVGVAYWQSDADRFDNPITLVVHTSKGVIESASERAALVGRALPAGFDAWFRKATHLVPTQRFRSASEQTSSLAAVLGVDEAPLTSSPSRSAAAAPRAFETAATAAAPRAFDVAAANAETLIAKTGPGTELDSRGALPETTHPRVLRRVGVGAAMLGALALGAALWSRAFAVRPSVSRESIASRAAVSGSAALVASPSSEAAPLPSARVAGAAELVEPAETSRAARSAQPAPLSRAIRPNSSKDGPARPSSGTLATPRKYTRD